MATLRSTGAHAPGKSYPHSIQIEPPRLIGGLVQYPLVSAPTQITILQIVDDTGSATIGDIIGVLPDHPDPVSAVLVMVELKILVIEGRMVLDANSIVRRADPEPDPENQGGTPWSPSGGPDSGSVASYFSNIGAASNPAVPDGPERLAVNPFSPNVIIGAGVTHRAFARMPELRRPGVYMLMNATEVYVGTGADVGLRVASGQQPIGNIETIVVITDAHGNLSEDDAKAAERMLWSRVAGARERVLVNGTPDGASIDVQRLSELEAMLGASCLALRHAGLMFTAGSARGVLAGPRQEPGRAAPLRPFNDIPSGEVLELNFGTGMVALASRQSDTRWLLLQGSDVRIDTVASANASTRFLRAAWQHAGLLDVAPDGRSLTTTRDLVFRSGSAVAQFCAGSKGRTLESWKSIAPDGGYDPDTVALVAG